MLVEPYFSLRSEITTDIFCLSLFDEEQHEREHAYKQLKKAQLIWQHYEEFLSHVNKQ